MKLHYKGKFSGNENDLPAKEHPDGAVMFREFKDMKNFAIIINIMSFVLLIACFTAFFIRQKKIDVSLIGAILPILTLFPHEFLHAICFRHDVYLYQNLSQGMLFVIGTEDMSKFRFIFLSLLPNIVFGFIPFTVAMIFPSLKFLGTFGAIAIGCGAGDYYNVFNALIQVPKGAKIYMSGFHSFWYLPKNK